MLCPLSFNSNFLSTQYTISFSKHERLIISIITQVIPRILSLHTNLTCRDNIVIHPYNPTTLIWLIFAWHPMYRMCTNEYRNLKTLFSTTEQREEHYSIVHCERNFGFGRRQNIDTSVLSDISESNFRFIIFLTVLDFWKIFFVNAPKLTATRLKKEFENFIYQWNVTLLDNIQ